MPGASAADSSGGQLFDRGAMMRDTDILRWVGEEAEEAGARGDKKLASIQLLTIRLALRHREDPEDLTKSLELSMDRFDRENLHRLLRDLHRKGWIEFAKADGTAFEEEEAWALAEDVKSERPLGFVRLTPAGAREVGRLQKVAHTLGFK